MSRRRVLLLTLPILVLLAAAVIVWFALPRKITVTIAVSGTPDLTTKGTFEIDGTPQEVTFTGSKDFVFEGRRLIYSFVSTDDSGEFQVRPRIGERTLMSGGSSNPPQHGLRGWVKSIWWGAPPDHWFEPFDRDEQQPKWGKPPP
jgi:hypothetical protein